MWKKNKAFLYAVELKKLKQEVVAMFKNFHNIKFGDSKFEKVLLTPYDDEICNFLGDFQKN